MRPKSWAAYNRRRSELLIKKHRVDGGLTDDEASELQKLQQLSVALADLVAPLPPLPKRKARK